MENVGLEKGPGWNVPDFPPLGAGCIFPLEPGRFLVTLFPIA